MGNGHVEAICIAPEAGAEMERVGEVEAVAGRGLRGDRYFEDAGTWSNDPDVDDIPRHLTLFEAETLEILARDEAIDLPVTDHRRNVTTRGVPVDHLLDERFRIGDAVCEGVRICEPCSYLIEDRGRRTGRAGPPRRSERRCRRVRNRPRRRPDRGRLIAVYGSVRRKPRPLGGDGSDNTLHSPPFDCRAGYSTSESTPSSRFVYIGYI